MPESLPAELPPETVEAYRTYLTRPTLTSQLLLAKVRSYIDRVSQANKGEGPLDIGTAGELAAALMRLLRECAPSELPHVQAATLYFIESEDSQPDLNSEDGFHDDAQVFNAVCQHLGKSDYLISLA